MSYKIVDDTWPIATEGPHELAWHEMIDIILMDVAQNGVHEIEIWAPQSLVPMLPLCAHANTTTMFANKRAVANLCCPSFAVPDDVSRFYAVELGALARRGQKLAQGVRGRSWRLVSSVRVYTVWTLWYGVLINLWNRASRADKSDGWMYRMRSRFLSHSPLIPAYYHLCVLERGREGNS